MKNEFKFKIIRIIISVLMFALIFLTTWIHFDKVLADEMIDDEIPMLIQIAIAILFYVIVHYSSIIMHELGHLFFGLKSKLKFTEFNIGGISFVKKNKKITVEKNMLINGLGGYCNMKFIDSIIYSNRDVIIYFYGGIIINIILSIIFLAIFLIFENEYIKFLSILFVIYNFYLAIYNSIPYCNLIGANTDMMHIVNYLHDKEYIKKMGIIEKVIKYYKKNESMKNIDKNLLYMPKKFVSSLDIELAEMYISYLSEIQDYKKMNDNINYVINSVGDKINESHKNSLKLQKIDYIVHTKIDKEQLEVIWDKSFNNYINQMAILSISGLAFKYLYYKIINIDDKKANDVLKNIQKRKKKYNDKQDLHQAEKLIFDVDLCLKK